MRCSAAYLSTDNLLHNLRVIKQHANKSKIIAMIKANGYGHGLRSTALRLQEHSDFLGVAAIDEALHLRQVGIKIPIVLMEGVFEPEELLIAAQKDFAVVFHSIQQIDWLREFSISTKLTTPINAWLKIDTGMGRLGFGLKEAVDIYQYLISNTNIAKPLGIMSHLSCADDYYNSNNSQQIKNFSEFIGNPKITTHKNIKSLCNSAGILNFPDQHYDVVRPGLALYGVSPVIGKSARELGLKPVMTLQTKIIAVKRLPKYSLVGYGGRFVCPADLKVAIIAIGYGDGYPRSARDGMPILINGQRCKMIGNVSMDMTAVDLTNCPTATFGDTVILWGEKLPIEEVATFTHGSTYDLLTSVQHRVKFYWY